MPTQSEIEYLKLKHQKFTTYKMKFSVFISLVANMTTAPFELIKVRSQILSEGRNLHGWGVNRGVPAVRMIYEVLDSGAGLRGLWLGFDSLFMRSLWQGTFRSFFWCYFFNMINDDPRSKAIY